MRRGEWAPMRKLLLPALRTQRAKYVAGVLCVLLAAALYLLPNRFHATPMRLPLTDVDTMVPFLPATGWLYASAYVLLLWAFFGMRDLQRTTRFLYACTFVQIVAAMVFVLYPIEYPRELFQPATART